jgi:uncharacterized protein HemX
MMDIKRYLSDEAVLAAPPSHAYRFKKFVTRNKGAVLAGGAVAATLILGLAGTAWQARVANGQRDAAVGRRSRKPSNARRPMLRGPRR